MYRYFKKSVHMKNVFPQKHFEIVCCITMLKIGWCVLYQGGMGWIWTHMTGYLCLLIYFIFLNYHYWQRVGSRSFAPILASALNILSALLSDTLYWRGESVGLRLFPAMDWSVTHQDSWPFFPSASF